jgi:hypothetical protein
MYLRFHVFSKILDFIVERLHTHWIPKKTMFSKIFNYLYWESILGFEIRKVINCFFLYQNTKNGKKKTTSTSKNLRKTSKAIFFL